MTQREQDVQKGAPILTLMQRRLENQIAEGVDWIEQKDQQRVQTSNYEKKDKGEGQEKKDEVYRGEKSSG